MATSMRLRTGTLTRTREADGAEIRTIRAKAHQAGEGKKRVADPRPSVEEAEAAGNPDRQVRAVQQAGAAVDKSKPPICTRRRNVVSGGGQRHPSGMFGGSVCRIRSAESRLVTG